MDINIRVKLEAPELIVAILGLTKALPSIGVGFMGGIKEEASKSNEGVQAIITIEQVREKLAALSGRGMHGEVKELIKRFGGSKLTDVNPEYYEDLFKAASRI